MKPQESMRKRLTFYFVTSLLCLLGVGDNAQAQVQTSSAISGTVTDSQGAAIAGASVTIKNQNTGATRNVASNESGFYSLQSIIPGTYTITVSQSGFKRGVVTDRVVQVAQPAQVDVTLQPGEMSEDVTVSAEGSELLTTNTAEIAGTINPRLVQNIPLNGRNFFNLAALTPGTVPQYQSLSQISFAQASLNFVSAANTQVSSGVFAGGNRDSAANVSVDGANVQSSVYQQTTQLQSPASIQEVKIQSGSMNAEFGNGVTAVNVITKSGTNNFHGELYEFLRNNKLDATPFFTNLAGRKLPNYQQNQFGGALGGPIFKDKLQFFANYEGGRTRQGTQEINAVPLTELRTGDFSNYRPPLPGGSFGPTPIIYNPYRFNPTTGLREPFPGNKIPLGPTNLCSPRPTCVDPVTLAFVGLTPQPNTVIDGVPQFTGLAKTTINANQYTARFDWHKSSNASIYGRYTSSVINAIGRTALPFGGTENPSSSKNLVVHWTQVINPSSVNDFSTSYTRPKWFYGRVVADTPDISTQLGLINTLPGPGAPGFGAAGFTLPSSNGFLLNATQNTFQIKDDLSLVRGNHNFKLGFDVTEKRFYYPSTSNDKGFFQFANYFTQACPAGNQKCIAAMTAAGLPQGGFSFADYLLGATTLVQLSVPSAPYESHTRYYGVYAQDSWQIRRNLTLNYGLRYEYWTPFLVPRNTVARFDRSNGNLVYPLSNPLDYLNPATDYGRNAPLNPGEPREGYKTGNKNFAPRVGMAYLLNPETTVRGSIGIYYDGNANINQFSATQKGVGPFGLNYQQNATGSEQLPPLLVSQQFPSPPPTAIPQPNLNPPLGGFLALGEPVYKTPTVYQWSLSAQRRLGRYWSLELDYLGSHTIREPMFINLNAPALPQGSLAGLTVQQRRPFPQWGAVYSWIPLGWAKYNAFTASVKNLEWQGLTIISSFTVAKSLISSEIGQSDIGNTNYRSPYIWAGANPQTPKFRFVSGWSYALPVGKGRAFEINSIANTFLGEWVVSGIAEFSTGSPRGMLTNDTSGGAGEGFLGRPNIVSGCDPNKPAERSRLQWFNTACFVNPPFGTFGNSTLGVFTEPGINNWNIAIEKLIPIKILESGRLHLRAEAFNAFNHTQWGSPQNYLPSSSFGRITTTRPARQIQLALKYTF